MLRLFPSKNPSSDHYSGNNQFCKFSFFFFFLLDSKRVKPLYLLGIPDWETNPEQRLYKNETDSPITAHHPR